ncbi:MAG TPA: septal ring lytic transglycosylase RlpA family protein [Alphaproteobacteria bacterium]|nr:MAG: RlpA-like protein [Alphaproteobacteria bacterium MarineAlpha9_Bin6]HIN91703.1 septal ring lytic transglycosylase RlpA family protein [Alphaproteobacteria bacterium]
MRRSQFSFRSKAGAVVLSAVVLLVTGCAETQLAIHNIKKITRMPGSEDAKQINKPKDMEPNVAKLGEYKVGDPYEISGVWYYPKANPNYDEVGIASWYGLKFHGKTTANGAVYDMNALTAAHKTLPMPSKVRVTNLTNGRSLIVDINDRGPFVNGRIIDLSRRASQLLGFEENGLAMVRIQSVSENGALFVAKRLNTSAEEQKLVRAVPAVQVAVLELTVPDGAVVSPPKEVNALAAKANTAVITRETGTLSVEASDFFVQVGAFLQVDNASTLSGRLSLFGPVRVIPADLEGRTYYRVRLGPVLDVDEADALLQRLINSGYKEAHLVLE